MSTIADLIRYECEVQKSLVIGHETVLAGRDALVLGIQTSLDDSGGILWDEEETCDVQAGPTYKTELVILYDNGENPEEFFDEELLEEAFPQDEEEDLFFDDEETYRAPTCREALLEEIKLEAERRAEGPQIWDIESFMIGEQVFPVEGMSNDESLISYKTAALMLQALAEGKMPDAWLARHELCVSVIRYTVDEQVVEAGWADDNLGFGIHEFEQWGVTTHVGHGFTAHFGASQEPQIVTVTGVREHDVQVKVYGLQTVSFGDRTLLVLGYETEPGLQVNFFSAAYLDKEAENGAFAVGGIGTDENQHRLSFVDYVEAGYHEDTQVELFSVTEF